MTPFLDQVARHYYAEGGVEDLCFIVPNRRAALFFEKYLAGCAAQARRPLCAPEVYTMDDFFYTLAEARKTDQVHLLLELYACYKPLYEAQGAQAEELDDFIFWGGVLLSDFGDVDKYLVDPQQLFQNIADYRGMQDDFDYLEESQVAAIRQFLSHFKTGGKYKEAFRRIWDILLPLYRHFNERLREQGMSCPGQVYRALAERLKDTPATDLLQPRFGQVRKFVFVGLNALNECEKRLMRRLRDAHLAEFCWDYGKGWISDPHNKSSFFLRDNVLEFPQAFEPDPEPLPAPQVHVLSVPSAVGQAKQVPAILDGLGARGIETAVVLPDEGLLMSVLNSIPERIRDINVTMGYPMSGSALSALMDDVAALQMHLREKDGQWFFTTSRSGPFSPTVSSRPWRAKKARSGWPKCAARPAIIFPSRTWPDCRSSSTSSSRWRRLPPNAPRSRSAPWRTTSSHCSASSEARCAKCPEWRWNWISSANTISRSAGCATANCRCCRPPISACWPSSWAA